MVASPERWTDATTEETFGAIGQYFADLRSDELGTREGTLLLSLYERETGRSTFGVGDDDNLATCEHCLLGTIFEDGIAEKKFFADLGTIDIRSQSLPQYGVLDAALDNVRLVEITWDPETFESSPVPGGECIRIESSEIAVGLDDNSGGAPSAGGAAGASGEGGAAGEGPEIPENCVEIEAGTPWIFRADPEVDIAGYFSTASPNLGSTALDRIGLGFFYNDEPGTFALGTGIDRSFFTCERCVTVNVPNGTPLGRQFWAVRGTLVIDETSSPLEGRLDATLTDVTWLEMNYNFTEFVTGGECLHLASATISLP
jgi:hypothetical protein